MKKEKEIKKKKEINKIIINIIIVLYLVYNVI